MALNRFSSSKNCELLIYLTYYQLTLIIHCKSCYTQAAFDRPTYLAESSVQLRLVHFQM